MSRFQALTNAVLDAELAQLRARLGLEPNQKAELLREMAAIAGWVARQAELGRTIEARRADGEVEPLAISGALREIVRCGDDEGYLVRLVRVLEAAMSFSPTLTVVTATLPEKTLIGKSRRNERAHGPVPGWG